MIFRKGYFDMISRRCDERLATDTIIIKQFYAGEQDGPLNAVRGTTFRPERILNCEIKISKANEETNIGTHIDVDALVWVYDSDFSAAEQDIVNIGGNILIYEVVGGVDYRIERCEVYSDCTKVFLRKM